LIKKSFRKGIILAGGKGTRLLPSTNVISKQLIPVYDKPLIYYPLTTLMIGGVQEILIITTPSSKELFERLLGNGNKWGVNLSYKVQDLSHGISHGISLAEDFVKDQNIVVALGDNIFHGSDFVSYLQAADSRTQGATVFAYPVSNPESYGVVNFNKKGCVSSLQEKPKNPVSQYAVTGLYYFDTSIFERIKKLKYSSRNELEVTELNSSYLEDGKLHVEIMGRGMAWFDTGTFNSLYEASSYIHLLQQRQGLKVGCPEEIAWRQKWLTNDQLKDLANPLLPSGYGEYLIKLLRSKT
tara:strand:- start:1307 stop:2197 length:891 start_codon:yes stop_codon:yes gene_type:complete